MALVLIALPLVAAALAVAVPSDRRRPWLMPVASLGHLVLVVAALQGPPVNALGNWLVLDPLGKVFLGFASVLFFLCSIYTAPYLAMGSGRPNRIFCACFLLSLSMMTLVILSHHLGLMWVGMEATTLAMAPNIYFYHTPRSLEATWKYLLICSVGIALALFGSFFLAYATLHAGLESTLLFDDLVRQAPDLSRPWLQAAFVLVLVGYGTKMGLAPMHTWLPDAHGEAPAPVSALLSGALLPCAFLAILRVFHICNAAYDAEFSRSILILIGLFSMAVGAVFMTGQRDLKRLLAYSSVEHMGILVLGIGIGGLAIFGVLLHVINNGLTKVALFLSAGNIQNAYGSRSSEAVKGVIRRLPLTGTLFLAGFLAITGSPPFGPFLSEFTIVNAALEGGQFLVGALFLLLLGIAFIGMGATIITVVQGDPPEQPAVGHVSNVQAVGHVSNVPPQTGFQDGFFTGAPILVAMGLVLLLGLYIPPSLESLLREAAAFLEVKR
jgi:hydrogenase-4 component F